MKNRSQVVGGLVGMVGLIVWLIFTYKISGVLPAQYVSAVWTVSGISYMVWLLLVIIVSSRWVKDHL